ncbi:MAG: hypothetical protein RL645_678 [Actinomycetota bacterium]|jgi:hypothetical protein
MPNFRHDYTCKEASGSQASCHYHCTRNRREAGR